MRGGWSDWCAWPVPSVFVVSREACGYVCVGCPLGTGHVLWGYQALVSGVCGGDCRAVGG